MQLIPTGDDFDVATGLNEWAFSEQIVELQGGRMVALWNNYSWAAHSSGQGYEMDDVYARVLEADGTPVGEVFRVNEGNLSIQGYSSITALDDGGFLVAWQTYTSGTTYLSNPVISARRFDADGVAQTGDFQVASGTRSVNSPDLVNLGNGTLLLTYVESQPYPAPGILKGVVLDSVGAPSGTPFDIGTSPSSTNAQAAGVLDNGDIIVAWNGEGSTDNGILIRILSPTGTAVTAAIQVDVDLTASQDRPQLAVLADGSVVVVWQDGYSGDYHDVYARLVAADGTFLSDPFIVETSHLGGDQSQPDVIALADGGFLVAWHTGDTWGEYDVAARRYDANGQPIESQMNLSSEAGGPEGLGPQLLELADGRIAAFWESWTWGSTSDMAMRIFKAQSFGTADADTIRGANADDWIDGQAGDDLLRGEEGNDLIYGNAGIDTIAGNDGNDTISGGSEDDFIFAGAGNDDAQGDTGNDSMNGGVGNDLLRGGDGNDTLDGESGRDTLSGNDGDDTLRGGYDDDRLFGGNGADDLNGEDGNDVLFGGTGNDMMRGGEGADDMQGDSGADTLAGNNGNDTLRGGDDADLLFGGDGNDNLNGDGGNDTVNGGLGDDLLRGGLGDDLLLGTSGADTLAGNDGNDTLSGGNGTDRLIAGLGTDEVSGGADADVFVWTSVSQSPHGTARDTITDFEHGLDKIDLSGIASGLTFVASYTGTAGEARYNATIGRLYIDTDGNLASDFSLDVDGAPAIDAGDLIL